MKLAVVILNWRTPALTIDCLRSLEPEVTRLPAARVVVTDNASGDDSIERIGAAIRKNGWEPWARLMPLPKKVVARRSTRFATWYACDGPTRDMRTRG